MNLGSTDRYTIQVTNWKWQKPTHKLKLERSQLESGWIHLKIVLLTVNEQLKNLHHSSRQIRFCQITESNNIGLWDNDSIVQFSLLNT